MTDSAGLSREDTLAHLQIRLNYQFHNPALAIQALTHSSARDKEVPCNERLEFLGDAILGHLVSEFLYLHFPDLEEGDLSTMKSVVVSAKTLAARANELDLERLIFLGRGLTEKKNLPRSILCNTFEALVAALYLDGGLDVAREFVLKNVRQKIEEILKDEHEKNYKSILQDHAQRTLATIPAYAVTKESGPDHKKMFQVVVTLDGKSYGPAWGNNKKEAEQRAAKRALLALGLLPNDAVAAGQEL